MEPPRPCLVHAKLAAIVGTWHGEERMSPSGALPAGAVGSVRLDYRLACDGFWIVGDYEQRQNGAVVFLAHSILGYDEARDAVVLHWFDSMGLGPDVFRGKLEGTRLTLESTNPKGTHRLTYDLGRPGELRSKMESSIDGRPFERMFEGRYLLQR